MLRVSDRIGKIGAGAGWRGRGGAYIQKKHWQTFLDGFSYQVFDSLGVVQAVHIEHEDDDRHNKHGERCEQQTPPQKVPNILVFPSQTESRIHKS